MYLNLLVIKSHFMLNILYPLDDIITCAAIRVDTTIKIIYRTRVQVWWGRGKSRNATKPTRATKASRLIAYTSNESLPPAAQRIHREILLLLLRPGIDGRQGSRVATRRAFSDTACYVLARRERERERVNGKLMIIALGDWPTSSCRHRRRRRSAIVLYIYNTSPPRTG